jgi:hypothetical protein
MMRPDRNATVEELVTAQRIKAPEKLPCVEVQNLVPLLELIQLLQDGHRDHNVVFLELPET